MYNKNIILEKIESLIGPTKKSQTNQLTDLDLSQEELDKVTGGVSAGSPNTFSIVLDRADEDN